MLYFLNFHEQKFIAYHDMTKVKTPMVLDPGEKIAELDWGPFVVTIEVQGLVSVTYEGNVFRRASQMPEELLDMFNNWTFDYTKGNIDTSNWFEVFLYYKDGDHLEWTGHSEVVNAEGLDEGMLKRICENYIDETTEKYIVVRHH